MTDIPLLNLGIIILTIEIVLQLLFLWIKYVTVAKDGGLLERFRFELFRGLLERTVLTVGMLAGFPQVLIPFGVLKLQNRIGFERDSDAARKEAARAYFLIGNLLTILVSILYVLIAAHGFEISLAPKLNSTII